MFHQSMDSEAGDHILLLVLCLSMHGIGTLALPVLTALFYYDIFLHDIISSCFTINIITILALTASLTIALSNTVHILGIILLYIRTTCDWLDHSM